MSVMTFAVAIYAAAIASLAAVAALSYQRREASYAARWLMLVVAAASGWIMCQLVWMLGSHDRVGRTVMTLAVAFLPILTSAYWMTVRCLLDQKYRPSRFGSVLLAGHPAAVALLAAIPVTRPWISGQYRAVGGEPVWLLGPGSWMVLASSALMLVVTVTYESRAMRDATSSVLRAQLATNLFGAVVPGIGALASLLVLLSNDGAWPSDSVEWMSVAFLFTGLSDIWSFYWQGLMETVPVARSVILEEMTDAVLFFDVDARLADLNRCARELLSPRARRGLLGMPMAEVLQRLGPQVRPESGEYTLHSGVAFAEADIRVGPVLTDGREVGLAMLIRDVTIANRSRRELAVANQRLRDQLAEIERLRGELAEQASRDSLTGVHNRRHLDRELAAAVSEGNLPVSLIVLDIDHFKAFNDRHGHLVGDEVLVAVAQQLAGLMEPGELLARFGGEEFVVVDTGLEWEQAVERAWFLQQSFFGIGISTMAGPMTVTVSAGLAQTPRHGHTPDDLFMAADEALYLAKSRGRNRVELPPSELRIH